MEQDSIDRLTSLVQQALKLSDRLGRFNTGIGLNMALVTLDSVGCAEDELEALEIVEAPFRGARRSSRYE